MPQRVRLEISEQALAPTVMPQLAAMRRHAPGAAPVHPASVSPACKASPTVAHPAGEETEVQ